MSPKAAVRIYLVYNQVGFWRSDEPQPQVDLIIFPRRSPNTMNRRSACAPTVARRAPRGVKAISWIPNVLGVAEAQKEARRSGSAQRARRVADAPPPTFSPQEQRFTRRR